MGVGHRHHQIHLKNLREGEQVLHNCSSHALIHLKQPLAYLLWVLLPLVALVLLNGTDVVEENRAMAWFLYMCYGLVMTTVYFVKGVNFELGGCVITNQRLLRFGYKGLWQAVEREILPNKIEDFKIEKKGFMSLFFNTAYIYIYTSNGQTDRLRWVIEPEKVQNAYALMVKTHSGRSHLPAEGTEDATGGGGDSKGAGWIDEAFSDAVDTGLNLETHRQGMIGEIGDVFKGKKRE